MATPTDQVESRSGKTDGGGPRRYLVTAVVMGSGIGFVFALVFYALIWMSADAVSAAEMALGHISRGNAPTAYAEGAPELRERRSLEDFAANMRELGLTGHSSRTWTTRTVDYRGGRLVADVLNNRGETVSLTVTVIRRDDTWKVAAIGPTQPSRRKGRRR